MGKSLFAGNLLRSIKSRFVEIKLQVTYASSMAADPRFRFSVTTLQVRNSGWKVNSAQLWRAWFRRDTEKSSAPARAVSSDVWTVLGNLGLYHHFKHWFPAIDGGGEGILPCACSACLKNPFLWGKNFAEVKYPSLSKLAWLHLSVPATQVSERGCSLPQVMLSLLEENTFSPSMLSNSFIHSKMH